MSHQCSSHWRSTVNWTEKEFYEIDISINFISNKHLFDMLCICNCNLFNFSCHILGNAGACLGAEFYTIANLAHYINNTVLFGLEQIPEYRLRPIIHILLQNRPFRAMDNIRLSWYFCRAHLWWVRHSCYNFSLLYVHCACVHASIHLDLSCPCTFMYGFQNSLAQLFSLRNISPIRNICWGRSKIKVTLEGQMIKWS